MPVITASVDPVSRIEGHLKVEVQVDTVNGVQQVVDAHSAGTLFRGPSSLVMMEPTLGNCIAGLISWPVMM